MTGTAACARCVTVGVGCQERVGDYLISRMPVPSRLARGPCAADLDREPSLAMIQKNGVA